MKLSWRSLFAAAGLLVGAAGVQANEISLTPTFDPFAASEITLVGHCTDGCADAGGCTDSCTSCAPSRHVGRDFWVCKDRCGGVVGGIDFLLLRPYGSAGIMDTGAGGPQLNFNPAMRYWFGYQNAEGLGGRIRYFEFDRGDTTAVGTLGVESRYFDAELTQAVDFRRWNLLLSGGIRYAEYQVNSPILLDGSSDPGASGFYGMGSTFGLQAARDLNKTGSLRFVSAARWSAVFGNNSVDNGAVTHVNDNLVNIFELNIGPQWRRQLRNGGYLTVGGGFEAQHWGGVIMDDFYYGNSNAGFAGFSSSIAITR